MRFIKIKSFCIGRKQSTKLKGNLLNGRRYLQMIYPVKGYDPKFIKNLLNSTRKKQIIQIKNVGRRHEQTFLKVHRQMANRHMERCSTSLSIRETHTKTTMRYHLTPVRMATINKSGNDRGAWVAQRLSVCLRLRA